MDHALSSMRDFIQRNRCCAYATSATRQDTPPLRRSKPRSKAHKAGRFPSLYSSSIEISQSSLRSFDGSLHDETRRSGIIGSLVERANAFTIETLLLHLQVRSEQ